MNEEELKDEVEESDRNLFKVEIVAKKLSSIGKAKLEDRSDIFGFENKQE